MLSFDVGREIARFSEKMANKSAEKITPGSSLNCGLGHDNKPIRIQF